MAAMIAAELHYRQANEFPFQVERTIIGIRKGHPSWGAPKIRHELARGYPMISTPAVGTYTPPSKEAIKPASFNFLQQQERFDSFSEICSNQRPHQALGGAYPGDLYSPSARVYEPPAEPEYP